MDRRQRQMDGAGNARPDLVQRVDGVRLSTLLDEVGLKPEARWVLAEGADGAAMTRSIPLDVVLDERSSPYAQNGEHLRPEQGYPLRLVLPGIEGNMSIKWLRRLKVGDQPFQSREETPNTRT